MKLFRINSTFGRETCNHYLQTSLTLIPSKLMVILPLMFSHHTLSLFFFLFFSFCLFLHLLFTLVSFLSTITSLHKIRMSKFSLSFLSCLEWTLTFEPTSQSFLCILCREINLSRGSSYHHQIHR